MKSGSKLSREDKEKVILTLSEIGIWASFKSGSSMFCDSISLMSEEKVKKILSILKPNADHFFKEHPCKEIIIENYITKCNERLKRINEVKQIKLNKIRGASKEEVVELILFPTDEQKEYLQKALDTFWVIYHKIYNEALEFNSQYKGVNSSEKKYYDFYKAIKQLPSYSDKEIDAALQRMAIICVQSLWKQHWIDCKETLETDRKKQVPFPSEPSCTNWFVTTKSGERSRLCIDKDFLKIPICNAIRIGILSGSHLPDTEIKSATIFKDESKWKATIKYKKPKKPA